MRLKQKFRSISWFVVVLAVVVIVVVFVVAVVVVVVYVVVVAVVNTHFGFQGVDEGDLAPISGGA